MARRGLERISSASVTVSSSIAIDELYLGPTREIFTLVIDLESGRII